MKQSTCCKLARHLCEGLWVKSATIYVMVKLFSCPPTVLFSLLKNKILPHSAFKKGVKPVTSKISVDPCLFSSLTCMVLSDRIYSFLQASNNLSLSLSKFLDSSSTGKISVVTLTYFIVLN